ncbi:hypothetical protein LCGC14_1719810 [marine sediment metagenome]|uniref:HK97 gp10 family phage protein n=1 Tax=marine sediment metagenome TaxID=412755 RepID=A0A0F9HCK9_9ZZZZ
MASRINWRGSAIKRRAEKAAILGIDATMSAAIMHARSNHGAGATSGPVRDVAGKFVKGSGGRARFQSRSGELERHTKVSRPARRTRRGVVGIWGVVGLVYGRRIELGFQGKDSAGRVVNAPAFPFLRPAAEAEYPKLAKRIRKAAKFA